MNIVSGKQPTKHCKLQSPKKSYKNINGMKYHARNGHKKDIGYVQIIKFSNKMYLHGYFYK